MKYGLIIAHADDGVIDATFTDVGHSVSDRASIAEALREIADRIDPAVLNWDVERLFNIQ